MLERPFGAVTRLLGLDRVAAGKAGETLFHAVIWKSRDRDRRSKTPLLGEREGDPEKTVDGTARMCYNGRTCRPRKSLWLLNGLSAILMDLEESLCYNGAAV